MRLIELVMSAFGPYREKQSLDFSQINDRKLFLITGPTGSGKTSIFDAISYALFGASSGNGRDGDSLRSDFSPIDIETYVTLKFKLKDNIYTVYRSPKQEKRKVKGEGTTIKPAEATLDCGNGNIYIGSNEVTAKIEEILGINYQQFRQIVMLPQGEFRKLLEADSKDRETIFRKIFQTDDFLQIQERLKEKTSELKIIIGDAYKLLDNQITNINCDLDSQLANLINATYKDYNLIIENLNKQILDDEHRLSDILSNINTKEQLVFTLTTEIEKGQSINQKFNKEKELIQLKAELLLKADEYKNLNNKLKKVQLAQVIYQIEEQINRLKIKINTLEKQRVDTIEKEKVNEVTLKILTEKIGLCEVNLEKIKPLNEKLGVLRENLRKFDLYDKRLKDLEKLKVNKEQINHEINTKSIQIEKLKQKIYDYSKEIERYQDVNEKLSEQKINQETLENLIKQNNFQLGLLNEVVKLEEQLRNLTKQYQTRNNEFKETRELYERKFENYLLGQAGILASSLEDNSPCPVCGSTLHPSKAKLIDIVPNLAELDKIKLEVDNKDHVKNDLYTKISTIHSGINDKLKLYHQFNNQDNNEIVVTHEILFITEKLNSAKNELNLVKNEICNLSTLVSLKNEKIKELEEQKIILSGEEEQYQIIANKVSNINNEYLILSQTLDNERISLGDYPNKDVLNTEIKNIEETIFNINQDYENLLKQISDAKNKQIVLNTNIDNIIKEVANNEEALKETNNKFMEMLNSSQFLNIDDYRTYLLNDAEITALEKTIRTYYDDLSYVEKTLKSLEIELTGLVMIDCESLTIKRDNEKEILKNLREGATTHQLTLQNNQKIAQSITNLYRKVKSNMERYEILSDISKAANGDNPQKLTFERYVLAAYFDEILMFANSRLTEMTNNRYNLCRKAEKGKGRSQQGLDLEVVDNYTSKSRLVNTLSGGEAFIASLALALGLADVIQSYSGGIQLDTIFIDEGFGSLDPESLDHAITTLLKVQKNGRLVGIISHVQELKERIDVKLEITPSHAGSHANFVL